MQNLHGNTHAKFRANMFNSKQVIKNK